MQAGDDARLDDFDFVMWEADRATLAVTRVTSRAARLFGPDWKGSMDRWSVLVPDEDRRALLDACADPDGERGTCEHRVRLKDGSERWFRTEVRARGALGLVAMMTDVTAYREQNAKLAHAESLLHTVLDQLPVVLFAVNREGIITLARGAGAKRLGPNAVGKDAFVLYKASPTSPARSGAPSPARPSRWRASPTTSGGRRVTCPSAEGTATSPASSA